MYKFKIFESLTDECSKIWEQFEKDSFHNFFQNYDFIKELISKKDSLIKIVIIYSEGRVIAVLPLEIKKYFIFKVLQWIGTGRSDFCNPLISKNEKLKLNEHKFLETWKEILNQIDSFDLIFFNNQPSVIEKINNPFIKLTNKGPFSKVYQIKLPDNFNTYKIDIKNDNKKHHYEIHRTLIKLSNLIETSEVAFDVDNTFKNEFEFGKIIKKKIDQLNYKKIK